MLPYKNKGYTLVEISIVLIIIGLLVGGIFSGMKMIDNSNTQKTIQDIKAIESAFINFKGVYRFLPGDMPASATTIPGCANAPCATGGNGNRVLEPATFVGAITNTSEVYTAWHHLQAAELINIDTRNTLDTRFGRGQPQSPIGGGYRLSSTDINMPWGFCANNFFQGVGIWIGVNQPVNFLDGTSSAAPCRQIQTVDAKIDDGFPHMGDFTSGWGCDPTTCTGPYENPNRRGVGFYDFKDF